MCKFSSSLVCDLCRLPYSNVEPRIPILLPSCCHTFCRQCLEEWTAGGLNAAQEFPCPTCKTQCDAAIESLGINHALMAEIESKLLASGELQLYCQGCSEKAEKHCVDCNVLLCKTCEKDHTRYKLFINHTIRPTSEMMNPPKARQMCTKHKTKELRLFCTTCQALICDDCPIKDHKDHSYDLLKQTAGDQRAELKEQAAMVEQAIIPLQQGVLAIKQEEVALSESREATKRSIKESYDALAGDVHKRSEELRDEVDDVYWKKQKVLKEQWKGVELVVASMKSASTHVRHVSDICNDQQVAEGFRQNVTSLQDLRDKRLDLSPDALGRIGFAWPTQETSAWLMDCIAKKGRVLQGEAKAANCVAEGAGLDKAVAGQTSTFRVLTKNHLGQPCTEGGEIVVARASASSAVSGEGGSANEFCVQDKSDGTYEVTYVAGGEGCVEVEVLINDCAVPGSPFCITVASAEVALRMQSAFDDNGAIHYICTAKGTRGWQNPHDTGDVIASISSVHSDHTQRVYGAET